MQYTNKTSRFFWSANIENVKIYGFHFHDLKLFHLIVHEISCIKLPSYLRLFEGSTRLRFTDLDHLCIITETVPAGLYNTTSKRGFENSCYYRTHFSWNRLPLCLREIISPSKFKIKLLELIWKDFFTLEHDSDNEYHNSGDWSLFRHFLSHKHI